MGEIKMQGGLRFDVSYHGHGRFFQALEIMVTLRNGRVESFFMAREEGRALALVILRAIGDETSAAERPDVALSVELQRAEKYRAAYLEMVGVNTKLALENASLKQHVCPKPEEKKEERGACANCGLTYYACLVPAYDHCCEKCRGDGRWNMHPIKDDAASPESAADHELAKLTCTWPRCQAPAICQSGNFGNQLVCRDHFAITNGVPVQSTQDATLAAEPIGRLSYEALHEEIAVRAFVELLPQHVNSEDWRDGSAGLEDIAKFAKEAAAALMTELRGARANGQ